MGEENPEKFKQHVYRTEYSIGEEGRNLNIICLKPGMVAQWGAVPFECKSTEFDPYIQHLLSMTHFSLFCRFKKSICKLLAKECALHTGKL